jgi:hypothetical protein
MAQQMRMDDPVEPGPRGQLRQQLVGCPRRHLIALTT